MQDVNEKFFRMDFNSFRIAREHFWAMKCHLETIKVKIWSNEPAKKKMQDGRKWKSKDFRDLSV